MGTAADRVRTFASAETLVQAAKHVEYEPMKVLKIGGIDVHKELNRFLIAWINKQGANELAEGMVDFFDDFGEKDIPEGDQTTHSADVQDAVGQDVREPDILKIFRDALNADSSGASRV